MSKRWAMQKDKIDGITLQSFWLGLSGGVLTMLTLNKAFMIQASEQTMSLSNKLHKMRIKYEIGGGVPYLLRDQAFVLQGLAHRPRQTHWLCLCVQDHWNQGIHGLAGQLNAWLARKY
ncbi:hypothetical protein DM01DRAFT_1331317 [Hesseltinella vesiculosa]|uniref:Uncharacterized protein n=1 Tax=Hesseltinella vesiculosa TaxID=101127 RepID=A0A1X2GW64_9FUNG|nr:hypothetical protein DM01DRAFT_1331317 [Hesseltinella vesiculosa]